MLSFRGLSLSAWRWALSLSLALGGIDGIPHIPFLPVSNIPKIALLFGLSLFSETERGWLFIVECG